MEQDIELVLLRHRKLFLVWREYHLLLQGTNQLCGLLLSPSRPFVLACRLCGCELSSVRCKPQDHQLYALHNRLRRVCHVPEEGSPQTTIRPILLGAYDDLAHRRLQVGIPDQRY